jgi:hypothetical protein
MLNDQQLVFLKITNDTHNEDSKKCNATSLINNSLRPNLI